MVKKGLAILGLLLVVGGGLLFYFFSVLPAKQPETDINKLMHVVTADMKHERTISWQAEAPVVSAELVLREKGSTSEQRVTAVSALLPSFQGNQVYIYTVHLTGLTAGVTYEYRIKMQDAFSGWHVFNTEPEQAAPFTALIFGDSQSQDYGVWAKTAQTAWQQHPEAAFFINMGDLVDNGQDDSQWRAWQQGAAPLAAAIPAAPVMGNHEAYSLEWQSAPPESYTALFALPANGPPGLEKYAYSYDYGDVHITVLNTQLNELSAWQSALFDKQKAWLSEDLAKTRKKWKVVLLHRGIWKFPFAGPLDEIGQTFVPIMESYQVDLVFTAHVHSYARTKALTYEHTGGPGIVYITTGRSGDKVWDKSPRKPVDEVFYNPLDMPNYLVLTASVDSLTVTAFKQNGEVLDRTELKKEK